MVEYDERNMTLVLGNDFENMAISSAEAATVYGIAQLSGVISLNEIGGRNFPYFTKCVHSNLDQVRALQGVLRYYKEQSRAEGWDKIALIAATGSTYSSELAELFIQEAGDEFEILAYQQFLPYTYDYGLELQEIQDSGARVIVNLYYSVFLSHVLEVANELGLVGENYVWLGAEDMVGGIAFPFIEDQTLVRGFISLQEDISDFGEEPDDFTTKWLEADPAVYPGAGSLPIPGYARLSYDSVFVAALAADSLDKQGILGSTERIAPEIWTKAINNVELQGVSGAIAFNDRRERAGPITMYYWDSDVLEWKRWSYFDPEATEDNELEIIRDVVWFSDTTQIPDLDIREPFDYWSCHNREERTDPTGKTISLHTPGSNNVDDIDSHYYCDNFIDCNNLSDESTDCASNYLVLFIVFGIITGILMFVGLLLLLFVLVFGIALKYTRLRAASPIFLVIILASIIVGYSSVFAWFGKPHPVACAFQPWILGLPLISMISALFAKNIRIWRIFKSEMRKIRITDLQITGLWLLLTIPALFIVSLWTIVSTPTARVMERNEADHYVCATGGFTGEPGGIVFASFLIGYGAILLVSGAVLSILIRKVPSSFNESKLLAISIYNLAFLSAVIIPVFLVVNPFNPFLAWIIRTVAVLYAFTATMFLQFIPLVFGIVFVDKLQNISTISLSVSGNTESKLNKY